MGLAAELSYTHRPPNAFQRVVQVLVATRPGAWFLSKTLARLDRFVSGLTHDRVVLPEVLAGLPVLVVTSTGRRSGNPRTTRLIAIPIRDTLALLGTNFGQPRTPTWVLNLEADPRATVTHRGITRPLFARQATETERAEVLRNSTGIYGGYLKYQQRIEGRRRLRIFVLEPADR